MKRITLSILLIFTSIIRASDLPQVPFLVTSGSAEISVKPSEVTVIFKLLVFNEKSEVGLNLFVEKSHAMKKLVKRFKVNKKDIEADDPKKDIVREEFGGGEKTKIMGYQFSRSYRIKLNDMSLYPSFISELFKLDNIKVIESIFANNKKSEYEEKLMLEAIKKAKVKAEKLAKIAGSEILGIYAISDITFDDLGGRFLTTGNCDFGDCEDAHEFCYKNNSIMIPSRIIIEAKVDTIFKLK